MIKIDKEKKAAIHAVLRAIPEAAERIRMVAAGQTKSFKCWYDSRFPEGGNGRIEIVLIESVGREYFIEGKALTKKVVTGLAILTEAIKPGFADHRELTYYVTQFLRIRAQRAGGRGETWGRKFY